ncbi:MAG: methyltransferase [Cytophagales bacterium]|nr:methyltransferase [Cytophagales bacterium]
MSKKYDKPFVFKQFHIWQKYNPLKITTEACVLGALVPVDIPNNHALDIGTGTGVIALMIAQKCHAQIHAVEIDTLAAAEASKNFLNSPWNDRLHIYNIDIQHYMPDSKYLFDIIICNPPFYTGQLLPLNDGKKNSKHTSLLSHTQLLYAVHRLLSPSGKFYVMLPTDMMDEFCVKAIEKGLFLTQKIKIYTKHDKILRIIACFEKSVNILHESELHICDKDGKYSAAFIQLMAPYYLDVK